GRSPERIERGRTGCDRRQSDPTAGRSSQTQDYGHGGGEGLTMAAFAIRNPYFIVVVCLIVAVVGATNLGRMPVDMFPSMDIPVVAVATFYNGMPPEQIEADITSRFERFFTLGSGIEHVESRSLPGVSVIKVFFQPGTNPDSAVTIISNLAMA